jgi:hypothetical protein
MTKRTHVTPQHDAHVEAWGLQPWEDFPPDAEEVTPEVTPSVVENMYVIAKSDCIENLYWNEGWAESLSWAGLEMATHYTREDIAKNPEAHAEGFWMPLERAEELEQ